MQISSYARRTLATIRAVVVYASSWQTNLAASRAKRQANRPGRKQVYRPAGRPDVAFGSTASSCPVSPHLVQNITAAAAAACLARDIVPDTFHVQMDGLLAEKRRP